MKNFKTLLTLLAIGTNLSISAQETGGSAVASAEAAVDYNWQNWTFAAVAMVMAAGAVYVVSLDSGNEAH
ncbi:MAG: hypothetical protein COT85_03780 [Chlamydiae bacterium CG10_big_fil_rev_8_21_14_0_10_42_34]|nr:MAG: hypothetical protein COT85_03780 [Chlamydiae bacterium CG10_big_fil_rev_8_21_14_0_10_42_34]